MFFSVAVANLVLFMLLKPLMIGATKIVHARHIAFCDLMTDLPVVVVVIHSQYYSTSTYASTILAFNLGVWSSTPSTSNPHPRSWRRRRRMRRRPRRRSRKRRTSAAKRCARAPRSLPLA